MTGYRGWLPADPGHAAVRRYQSAAEWLGANGGRPGYIDPDTGEFTPCGEIGLEDDPETGFCKCDKDQVFNPDTGKCVLHVFIFLKILKI